MPTPKLEFCIAHDYGVVRTMAWCPHRCWQTKDTILVRLVSMNII